MLNPGWRIVHPLLWLLTESSGNTTNDAMNAHARVPSARLTPPSFVIGNAMSAPTAAATTTAITIAQRKLSWPCVATPGTFTCQFRLTAQPAVNPPTVTNVACARLTIPPSPVTTTNDKKITEMASPCAIQVCP
jgi:hypothetical protein